MRTFLLPVVLAVFFAAGFIACETTQAQTAPAQNKGELAGISIRPLNAAVDVGDDLELVAKGFDAMGNEIPIRPSWKQVSGTGCGLLQSPQGKGDKAIITGVRKGKARVGIEIQGFSLEVDVMVRNVSKSKAAKSFK